MPLSEYVIGQLWCITDHVSEVGHAPGLELSDRAGKRLCNSLQRASFIKSGPARYSVSAHGGCPLSFWLSYMQRGRLLNANDLRDLKVNGDGNWVVRYLPTAVESYSGHSA